ncbi:MAG: 2-oxoacid:acceptor oxidoreductase subunit alpha [Rhodospirillaceae bacterium]|nr:2-oxoacid:acceptor oxidoreductase subunit alpha [Rhodospirillaceae bacterium]
MSTAASTAETIEPLEDREELESVVIRFAGDSGDGVQVTGGQLTQVTALAGNDLATFPDFPAEIRAPAGTTYGVSAFQINFGARRIRTAGDRPDVLVAFNPAALKVNIEDMAGGSLVIVDTGTFSGRNMKKAGYDTNPLEDRSLDNYRVVEIDISKRTLESVGSFDLTQKQALRCKNFWTLGLIYWLYGRDRQPTIDWLNVKFGKIPTVADANVAAVNAGHAYGETAELGLEVKGYVIPPAEMPRGLYRTVTGADATAYGLVVGTRLAGLRLMFGSYPITPASALLHALAGMKEFDVITFQAEDEISAVCSAIGASYAGSLGVTSSSGPGVALKTEAIGLAVSTELPLVIVNSQRSGPSTGMPTKTEQSDLYQAVYGRNADTPVPVIAASSPADAFDAAIEAVRIATKYMTPVFLLTDSYIVNAAEPWLIPDVDELPRHKVEFRTDPERYHPFLRDEDTLARAWALPGTPGLEHRIGGLEKDYDTGNISYDPENHHRMTMVRKAKIDGIADDIPPQTITLGSPDDAVAVVGWGSTYGPINRAVDDLQVEGMDVSHIHIRHLWPLPRNLGRLLQSYEHVLVPEMNTGQLRTVLRSEYLVPAVGLNNISGLPFKITEIKDAVRELLEG